MYLQQYFYKKLCASAYDLKFTYKFYKCQCEIKIRTNQNIKLKTSSCNSIPMLGMKLSFYCLLTEMSINELVEFIFGVLIRCDAIIFL